MTEFAFAPLVAATREALAGAPDGAAVHTFRVSSRQTAGLRSDARVRSFELGVDEPPSLGTRCSRSPRAKEITYRLYADHLGIPLDGVAVSLEGDIDLRGFFGVDRAVRPGFLEIRGSVRLDSPLPGRARAAQGPRGCPLAGARPAAQRDSGGHRPGGSRTRLTGG